MNSGTPGLGFHVLVFFFILKHLSNFYIDLKVQMATFAINYVINVDKYMEKKAEVRKWDLNDT